MDEISVQVDCYRRLSYRKAGSLKTKVCYTIITLPSMVWHQQTAGGSG